MQRKWILLVLVVIGACSQKSTPVVDGKEGSYSLAIGEKLQFPAFTLTLTDIRESRCPMNARCIRAGEAIAVFQISDTKAAGSFSLCVGTDCSQTQTGNQFQMKSAKNRYLIQLQKITPNPTKTLKQSIKKAVFSIEKQSA